MTTRQASNILLVVGYPVAVAAAVRLVPMFRERRLRRFLALEAGTACVIAGLLLRRRWIAAALNVSFFVGLAAAWAITRNRRGS